MTTAALALLVGTAVAVGSPAVATTAGDCTPENSVSSAAGGTPADIQALLDGDASTVCLTGEFTLTQSLMGSGNVTIIGNPGATLDGGGTTRLYTDLGSTVALQNLSFRNGRASGSGIDSIGGAVLAIGVIAESSTFVTNTAEGSGGAIATLAGTVTGSTFIGNQALSAYGGAVLSETTLTVVNSTFVENSAVTMGGAVLAQSVFADLSTFVDNSVAETSGDHAGDSVSVIPGGGGYSTLYGNVFAGSGARAHLGQQDPDDSPIFIDQGGNVFTTSGLVETELTSAESSVFDVTIDDIFGADREPADHGGLTPTVALREGSAAIDVVPARLAPLAEPAAEPTAEPTAAVDQRGVARTGELVDAGSFEFVPAVPAVPALAATGSAAPLAPLAGLAALTLGLGAAVLLAARRRLS